MPSLATAARRPATTATSCRQHSLAVRRTQYTHPTQRSAAKSIDLNKLIGTCITLRHRAKGGENVIKGKLCKLSLFTEAKNRGCRGTDCGTKRRLFARPRGDDAMFYGFLNTSHTTSLSSWRKCVSTELVCTHSIRLRREHASTHEIGMQLPITDGMCSSTADLEIIVSFQKLFVFGNEKLVGSGQCALLMEFSRFTRIYTGTPHGWA